MPAQPSKSEAKRVGLFGIVGLVNTVIDFTILNIGVSVFHLVPVIANLFSTSTAMVFSFFLNKKLVFRGHQEGGAGQVVKFFVITAFGLWIIQGAIINYFTTEWFGLANFTLHTLTAMHLGHIMSYTAMATNSAKIVAIIVSLTWNYILYKNLVFKHVAT